MYQAINFSVRSVRDLKTKVAAAETLFDAKAFDSTAALKLTVFARGIFSERRSGDPVFCNSHFEPVVRLGYTTLVIQGDDGTKLPVRLDPAEHYAFQITVG